MQRSSVHEESVLCYIFQKIARRRPGKWQQDGHLCGGLASPVFPCVEDDVGITCNGPGKAKACQLLRKTRKGPGCSFN